MLRIKEQKNSASAPASPAPPHALPAPGPARPEGGSRPFACGLRTACAQLELSGLALSGQGSQSAGFAQAGCLKFSGLWLAALWESVQSPSVGAKSEAFGSANSQWAARLPFAACGPSWSEAPRGQVANKLL